MLEEAVWKYWDELLKTWLFHETDNCVLMKSEFHLILNLIITRITSDEKNIPKNTVKKLKEKTGLS